MLRIRRQNTRRPPVSFAGAEVSREEEALYHRKVADEIREDLTEIAAALDGDGRDEVVVVSQGDAVEVAVAHDLGMIPTRFRVVDKDGAGDLWRSRDHQWDEGVAYFKTSADAGVSFTVVLFARS